MTDKNYFTRLNPTMTEQEAEAAANAFAEDLLALCDKHKIADVSWGMEIHVMADDGPTMSTGSGHIGNVANAEGILAAALGRERKRRENVIGRSARGFRQD